MPSFGGTQTRACARGESARPGFSRSRPTGQGFIDAEKPHSNDSGADLGALGAGATLGCPTAANDYGSASVVGKKVRVGKDERFVVAFIADLTNQAELSAMQSGYLSVQAYPRDMSGRLLAAPQQRYRGTTNDFDLPKIKPSAGGLTVEMPVFMGQYPICNPRPTCPVTEQITVKHGKVTITETEGPRPICTCCDGE